MENCFNVINFIQLSTWDINRIFQNDRLEGMVPLSSFLKQYQKVVSKEEAIDKHLYIVSKISFGGTLYLNDFDKIYTVKGSLYEIPKNAITYSKINVRHGCCYWNTTSNSILASSEYPTFIVDENKVLPEYLIMVLRHPRTLKQFNSKLRGFTKARVSVTEFLLTKIPLSSIERQRELVAQYNALLNLAKDKENQAVTMEQSIDDYLMAELGIKENLPSTSNNLFQTVEYKNLDKWEINKNFFLSAKYNIVDFDKNSFLFTLFKRGKSPKYAGVSNCYAINQKCVRLGYIDLQYKKYIDEKWNDSINKDLKTKIGDILINSTGEGTIGRAAIVAQGQDNLVYDSHILNLRLNVQYLIPSFFVKIFNSPFVQKQINLYKSGTSTKQTELGVENAKKIKFPLPPLNVQNQIVKEITFRKEQIKSLRKESEKLRLQAISDFEKEVFN